MSGAGAFAVLLVAKAEMGVLTFLSRILAEELDVDWANVDVQQAQVNTAQYDHLTVGSDGVRSRWLPLRRAGAQARNLLVRAAAAGWGVLPDPGEVAVPPVAPAIANAVFQLTGRRVRSLPIAQALITSS